MNLDEIALAAATEIENLGHTPLGGASQRKARIQNIITEALRGFLPELLEDATRLDKLLSMVDECRIKFDNGNRPRKLRLTIKNSVFTTLGYRGELRKLIDDMEPIARAE